MLWKQKSGELFSVLLAEEEIFTENLQLQMSNKKAAFSLSSQISGRLSLLLKNKTLITLTYPNKNNFTHYLILKRGLDL